MRKRKEFIIYPPDYKPGDGFKVRKSKRQANKVADHWGAGAEVWVCIVRVRPTNKYDAGFSQLHLYSLKAP